MTETKNNDERFPEVKPTKPGNDTAYIAPIIGKLGYDTRRPWLFGLGTSPNNGVDFHVFLSFDGLNFDDNDIDKIWNGGTADKVKKEVDSATAEIPAAVSAANSAVQYAESAVAASRVNSDAIVAQSEAISEAKSAMDSATAEIQQTAANAASDAAKIRADVAQVQSEVDTAKAASSASVEALKSDIDTAKQDLANVHDSLTKAQSAVEHNQKLINDSVAKITSDVSATKQDLATVHDSLTKAQAAAEQNQKAINDSIAEINANVDATNQDLAGVRKDLTKAQSDIIANQKAVNDNVAQINSDIEQDRKDIASAQQANADTVKQLDAYSKQAQEQGKTIKAVQDKQDGFSATLADAQGNVSQVSDKVSGLSASLKDTQDNVASVKAQADQLSATLTDHSKSIAILTASAKELSSTLEDADGRLSKVEQTAQTNSSTLSDVQGDLSQVKQNATKLVSTLKDAQGNISTLQQKADSVSAQLASAQGDIATLQTDVDGVKATLTSHDKSIHTLQADSKSLKDSMVNAQGDISTLQKSATSLDSEMKDHAGRLSKVEQNAATQATTLSDLQGNLSQVKQQADGLVTTLKDAQGNITQVQQKADSTLEQLKSAQGDIASLQTDVTGIKATLVSHEGDIHTLQADSKTLKDDMQDAQGNISSLQKSSTKLNSEFSSQDGRLSKVEQTAKEHTSTISDLGKKVDSNGGGVNLLTNTQLFDHNWSWDQIGHSFASGVLTLDGNADATSRMLQQLTDNDITGKTFSVSFNARICADCDSTSIEVDAGPYDATKRINITSKDFQRYKVENWQWNSSSIFFSFYVKNGRIDLTNLKLEYGAVATPYSLAPADLATISQVKQTADGITTTLKNVQGDVDQVTQKANGTSEQLADVQGDVTNIQKDVNGLKQTTADNAGNIHTLQADSKSLHDSMQDAQGDISTLKKTSTDVTSELKDHAGRISKTEQTASTLTNEFSDEQGHLNRVEQTAQGTQRTVANQQGQINTIKTDTAGIHETLTGQGNQIANINVTLNGLNSKYEGVSGDLGKLKDQVTTNSTQITQNKQAIALKADQSTVDNLSGEVSQNKAQLKVQADQISSKVSSKDFKTLDNKVNGMKFGTRNLLHNTSDQYRTLTGEGWMGVYTSSDEYTSVANYHSGDLFTYAATISNASDVPVELQVWRCDQNKNRLTNGMLGISTYVYPGQKNIRVFLTGSIDNNTWYLQSAVYSSSGQSGQHTIQVKDERLVEGNVAGTWEANPADIVAFIQNNSTAIDQTNKQISLKADQTEVDKIKNTASYNSSRLDVMANEISSKVTSTDVNNIVDGKGYATTSTVQSLITQKAGTISESITSLDSKYNTTVTQVQSLTASIDGLQSTVANKADKSQITQLSNVIQSKVSSTDFNNLRKAVDLQTLDSADINSMKTNGHYFVRNLANNPVGGWVYVDVTGNGNDRIRQDVYQDNGNEHKYRRWVNDHWTNWDEGANYSEITQLRDDINLRVKKGDLLSQINIDAGHTLIQSNKIYLAAGNVVFSDSAFIPSAAIENLDASKLTFYGPYNAYATIGSSVKQYDDDKQKSTINLQYNGGVEVHASNQLGSILAMHDDTVRLAVKSQVYGSGSGQPLNQQYSGVWFGSNYTLLNSVDSEGRTTGISIGSGGSVNQQYRFVLYDDSKSNVPSYGVKINTQRFNVDAGSTSLYMGPDDINLSGKGTGTFRNNDQTYIEGGGGSQIHLTNGNIWIGNPSNKSATGLHLTVQGWATYAGYVEAMGWTTKSTLSSKTRIEPLDTADALDKITSTDLTTYQYKAEVSQGLAKRHAGLIIDDVHDVAQYSTPDAFVAENRQGRSDADIIGYLMGAVQELKKQLDKVKKEVKSNE